MKQTLILLVFLLTLSFAGFGQTYLCLSKNNSEKQKVITEGRKVKVLLKNNQEFKGKLSILDEETILLENDTILLNSIVNVRVKTITHILSGSAVFGAGAFITYVGGNLFVQTLSQGDIAIMIGTIIGVPIALSGVTIASAGIVLVCLPKNHYLTEWTYSIENK